jgi:4-hydroxy-tetrahydrodipicolinate synthase
VTGSDSGPEVRRPRLLAASLTPFAEGGASVDVDAIEGVCAWVLSHGADGIFALGTTGEGVNLEASERRLAAEAFRAAVPAAAELIVHCGAQTTAASAHLAGHARSIGVDGVAVIPPPYFPLREDELVEHFVAVARACEPVPFYLYAFAARSGYELPPAVIERVAGRAGNVRGVKVSEGAWDRLEQYLHLAGSGLDVFVGAEPLLPRALEHGIAGSVSGLAAAFPDAVRALLDEPAIGANRVSELRRILTSPSFVAAQKVALAARGVRIGPDLRAPQRAATGDEAAALLDALRAVGAIDPQGAAA